MANKAGLSDLTLRFLKQMQELNLTGYQLKKDGVIGNEATLTKIKQGLQQPSRKTLDKFCDVYNLNKVWLLTGEGEMLKKDVEATEKPRINYKQGVPYYNVDFIGGFEIVENERTVNPEYLIDFKPYAKATCWCNISGHSMEPEINSGDIIALRRIEDFSFLPMGGNLRHRHQERYAHRQAHRPVSQSRQLHSHPDKQVAGIWHTGTAQEHDSRHIRGHGLHETVLTPFSPH